MDYRYGSHTVFQIEYHFVWVAKYRYKVLTTEVQLTLFSGVFCKRRHMNH